jgi:hypothetical protein
MLMKKSLWVVALYLLLTGYAHAQISETKAIEYVRQLSPSVLDTTLPKGHFSDWLTRILGEDTTVEWELNDCGEQTGDPAIDKQRDLPVCVGIYAHLTDRRRLWITILVGTNNKGLIDSPAIYSVDLESDGQIRTIKRLSDLENALRQSSK